MSRALADTSIFIAREDARPLGDLPAELAVSVVTIGELEPRLAPCGPPVACARCAHRRDRRRARLPVVTQDDDFAAMATAHPALTILRV